MSGEENYRTYYKILALEPGCSWLQLKAAYRRAVHSWHPDRFQGRPEEYAKAEKKIKEINYAFHILAEYYRKYGSLPDITADPPAPVVTSHPRPSYRQPSQKSVDRTKNSWRYRASARTSANSSSPSHTLKSILIIGVLSYAIFNYMAGSKYPEPLSLELEGEIASRRPMQPSSDLVQAPLSGQSKKQLAFTFGSTMGDVFDAQGTPSRSEGNTWYYGNSRVFFEDGRVVNWEDLPSNPLRTSIKVCFTLGSTKAEVRHIQGNPLQETEDIWIYGISRVHFKEGKVSGWYNSVLDPLRIKELKNLSCSSAE